MKILVTGANGQVGTEIRLLEQTQPDWQFHFHDVDTLDIVNEKQVGEYFGTIQPDVCINSAAYTAVDKAESDELQARGINADGPALLARACSANNSKLIHLSTDFVFDGKKSSPYKEEDQPNPLGVYASTKLEGDLAVQQHCSNAIILRTSGVYSNYGNNFVKTMKRLGSERDQLKVIYDQAMTPTYARDIAQAIIDIIPLLNHEDKFGLYNYTNEGVASWYDLAVATLRISGIECEVLPIETHEYPTPARRPSYSVLHKGKIKEAFGLSIPHWRKSLEECLKA